MTLTEELRAMEAKLSEKRESPKRNYRGNRGQGERITFGKGRKIKWRASGRQEEK